MIKIAVFLSWYVSFGRTLYTDNKCMFFQYQSNRAQGRQLRMDPDEGNI